MLFGAVGEKAEVTDTHEAVGEHVEEKAVDKLLGVKAHRFQAITVFSIPVGEGDPAV